MPSAYSKRRVTKVLHKNRTAELNSAVQRLFLKLKHCASSFCPAILRHIFPMKVWFSGVQITEVITSDPFGIDTVIGGFMTKDILSPDGFQRGLQIHNKLAKICGIFAVIRMIGKQHRTDLLCCNACAGAVHQNSQKLFRFFRLKGKLFPL